MPESCLRFHSEPELIDYIRALPKAEVHLHLEGTVELPTCIELAARHSLPTPTRALYEYQDFWGFLQCFKGVCGHLKTATTTI